MSIDTLINAAVAFAVIGIGIWASIYIKTKDDLKQVIQVTKSILFRLFSGMSFIILIYFLVIEFTSKEPITRLTLCHVSVNLFLLLFQIMMLFVLKLSDRLQIQLSMIHQQMIDGEDHLGVTSRIVGVLEQRTSTPHDK